MRRKGKLMAVGIICILTAAAFAPVAFFISFASGNGGNTLYVGGDGPGNYTSIGDAISAAENGDNIFVYTGNYSEHLVVNKTLNIIGEDENTTIIDGGGIGMVVQLLANNIRFSGFTVRNGGRDWSDGLVMCDGDQTTITDVLVNGGRYGFIVNASGCVVDSNRMLDCHAGICIAGGEGNVVTNNTMVDQWGKGIDVENAAANTTVRGNYFKSTEIGPASLGGRYTLFDRNTVEGDENNGYAGIWLAGKHVVVSNNTFIKCGLSDFYAYISCEIYNNTVNGKPLVYMEGKSNRLVEDAGQVFLINCSRITVKVQNMSYIPTGIFLFNSHECTISSSTVSNTWIGIRLSKSTDNVIIENNILSAGYAGISLAPFSDGNIISHNIINDNSRGMDVWSSHNEIYGNTAERNWLGINLDYGSEKNNIKNNTIGNNTVGIDIWQDSSNNVVEGNNIKYNSAGVALGYSCQENEISENEISHNTRGIDISMSSDRNRVEGNTISENTWGVSVGSKYNVITANVFLNNKLKDATFLYPKGAGIAFNNWNGNYWGRPHLLPKPIFGWHVPFPWVAFDWRPLLVPP